MDSTIFNPNVPFTHPLPSSLQPGHIIRINGIVNPSANCFSINLQNGPSKEPRSDIALHLSPVFNPPPRLVRNSLENQSWGPEESHGAYFPFQAEQGFEILILIEADNFKIAVNGQHFTEFQYRLPIHYVSHVAVDGDVKIATVKFEGLAKTPIHSETSEVIRPLGFVSGDSKPSMDLPVGRPSSPYASPTLPYPSSFGPSPTNQNYLPPAYGPPNQSHPYGPPSPSHPYGPPSPSHPYGPPSPSQPYGPSSQSHSYGPQGSGYPPLPTSGYDTSPSSGAYPYGPPPGQGAYPHQSGAYPSQPGPYPGTSVVYPGQEKKSSGGMNLGPLAAAGAAALAGMAGSAVLGGKHKKKKHGHGMLGAGAGPASLIGGVSSLLGGNKSHGHSGGSGIPLGGAVAGGAAALAGAYMLSKSPIGKVMKPKKMKKLYKHKHKGGGWGGFGSSSSSSSD